MQKLLNTVALAKICQGCYRCYNIESNSIKILRSSVTLVWLVWFLIGCFFNWYIYDRVGFMQALLITCFSFQNSIVPLFNLSSLHFHNVLWPGGFPDCSAGRVHLAYG